MYIYNCGVATQIVTPPHSTKKNSRSPVNEKPHDHINSEEVFSMKNRFQIWSAGHGRYFCYVEDRKMKNKIEKINKCNLTAYYMTKSGRVFGWQFLVPDVEIRDFIQQIK